MAQYPIDIKIDTANADRNLNNLNSQLDQTEKSTIAAAQAANQLSTAEQQVAKAAQQLAQQQANHAARSVAVARATRDAASAQLQLEKSLSASTDNFHIIARLQAQVKKATDDESKATDELTNSLKRLAPEQKKVSDNAKQVETGAKKTTSALDTLVTGAKAFVGLQVAGTAYEWGKAFVDTATKVELLQSRINLYTATSVESQQIFAQLVQQANRAGTDIDAVANSFQRFAAAGKDAGISNQVILQFTDNLQKMARVSGASSAEASAAIYQLSQAFASGRLQGDEFRSVSEQLPTVLQVLAKQMGVTTGELKQLGSDGEITRDKLLLLNNATDDISAQFARLPRSVDQSATALRNNLSVAIAELDQQIGASKFLAKFLDMLSGGVSGATELIKAADQTNKLAQATNTLNGVTAKREANLKEIADLEAQIQRGYTTQTVGGYTKFVNDTGAAQKKLNELKKIDLQLTKQQADAQRGVVQATPLGKGVAENLASQASQFQASITAAQAAGRPDAESAKQIKNLKEQVTYTKALADGNYELAASQKLGNKATKEQIADYAALLKQQNDFKQSQKDQKKSASDESSAAKRAQKELERNQAANEKYLKTLQDKVNAGQYDVQLAREQVQLNMTQGVSVEQLTASYQKSYLVQQQLLLQSQQAEAQSRLNKDATDAERAAVDAQVAALQKQQQAKQLAAQVSQVQSDVQGQLNPYQASIDQTNQQEAQRLTVIQQARDADLINEQQYQDMKTQIQQAGEQARTNLANANYSLLLQSSADFLGQMAAGLAQSKGEQSNAYKAMFALSKAFSIAQASINLWTAVSQAMALPFPANIPFAAKALAEGTAILGNIQSIAGTGFATGGYVSGPGTGQSDSINARLSNGEFVSTKQATSRYRTTLEAMNRGTYTPGSEGGSAPNIQVHNYGGERVQVKQGLTRDDVIMIIGEEFPTRSAQEWNDPYSTTNKAFKSNYDANRKI
ncbi:tape measure protein [Salmonella enterica subsp. enterica serovar Schwarzengrund]|nr:tape measure protein [Salmonella enterica subsp. enterica serovar Schwarzengrund]